MDTQAQTHTVHLDLSCVSSDDQTLVQNVCSVITVLRNDITFDKISITNVGQMYHITAELPIKNDIEISKTDIDTITDVNPLRVSNISVQVKNERLFIKVRVCAMDYPISVTDTSIVKVIKKRRWFI